MRARFVIDMSNLFIKTLLLKILTRELKNVYKTKKEL